MTEGDKKVTRAEFFSKAFKESVKAALNITENMVAPLERLKFIEENWLPIWNGEITENEAKFVFYQGHPYFLLKTQTSVRAFSGLCPNDSNLVYVHHEGFTCSQCGSSFKPADGDQKYRLQEFKTKVVDEKIFIAL
ncbi:MAG TPA: hypothetical protein VFF14_03320 [Candidatus Deferrimicrobium sp.]|nr:hypothetical protein [Candidatus Deferrimicrobium sp.]